MMLSSNIRYPDNAQHMFFQVLSQYSRYDEKVGDSYRFLSFLSVFQKYELFARIGANKLSSGALNWAELKNAVEDSEGPS